MAELFSDLYKEYFKKESQRIKICWCLLAIFSVNLIFCVNKTTFPELWRHGLLKVAFRAWGCDYMPCTHEGLCSVPRILLFLFFWWFWSLNSRPHTCKQELYYLNHSTSTPRILVKKNYPKFGQSKEVIVCPRFNVTLENSLMSSLTDHSMLRGLSFYWIYDLLSAEDWMFVYCSEFICWSFNTPTP
jgi:hypothetical protein